MKTYIRLYVRIFSLEFPINSFLETVITYVTGMTKKNLQKKCPTHECFCNPIFYNPVPCPIIELKSFFFKSYVHLKKF